MANGEHKEVVEAFGFVPNCELSIHLIPVLDDRVNLLLEEGLVPVGLRNLIDHRLGCNIFYIDGLLDTAGVALVKTWYRCARWHDCGVDVVEN